MPADLNDDLLGIFPDERCPAHLAAFLLYQNIPKQPADGFMVPDQDRRQIEDSEKRNSPVNQYFKSENGKAIFARLQFFKGIHGPQEFLAVIDRSKSFRTQVCAGRIPMT